MPAKSSVAIAETRVRDHFDASTQLYAQRELACYRKSVEQRLDLLEDAAGMRFNTDARILDIGCGAGLFIDMFLDRFPNSSATGIDLSEQMLALNLPSPRKSVHIGDALSLHRGLGEFDAICIDTVMHHLISSSGYAHTLERIQGFLRQLPRFLLPGGVILIREIYHEYRGIEALGSRAVYEVSTLRVPKTVSDCIKYAGIQTANAGVCFLTRAQWSRQFAVAGFEAVTTVNHQWPGQPYRKFGFAVSGDIHYLLRSTRPNV